MIDLKSKINSSVFKNSLWGLISNVLQNILFSIFFIVLARKYSIEEFGNYVIANTIYSFILGFSTLGLGHWFIREHVNNGNNKTLVDKFFKMQLYIGIVFYVVNVIISYSLYNTQLIRTLSLIIGINIIFDNLINVIKSLNMAEMQQKKTFILLTIEAFLKFLVACLLFIYPINIIIISFILITLRLITLNLFIKFGSSNSIGIREIFAVKIKWSEIKNIIGSNWSFVIISSLSIVNWRIGNILVSKILTIKDVTNYEVSFKLFSIAYILPIIITSTLFPILIKAYKDSLHKMKDVYNKAFLPLCVYGFLSYTFVYSYSDFLIPFVFGAKYTDTAQYCKEMFLVMLIFPTIFLQANVLITLKLEKLDMLCNIASLSLNVLFCCVGFYFFKSLSVVNYAIFFSFLIFHLIQDIILIKRKVTNILHVSLFYLFSGITIIGYYLLSNVIQKEYLFVLFWFVVFSIALTAFVYVRKRNYLPK
jgi:O-antigen/teichoic acid export membrane protein